MDLEELDLDEDLKPMSRNPEEPIFYYHTVHRLTRGPRGVDRNAGRGGRTTGQVARCAGRTQGRAPGWGEQTPSGSAGQSQSIGAMAVPTEGVNGSLRSRPPKSQTVEVNSAEAPTIGVEVPVNSPVRESTPVPRSSPLEAINSIGMTVGYGSSMRQRIYEVLSVSSFLADLGSRIYSRVREWIETKEVPVCAAVKASLACPSTTPGQIY